MDEGGGGVGRRRAEVEGGFEEEGGRGRKDGRDRGGSFSHSGRFSDQALDILETLRETGVNVMPPPIAAYGGIIAQRRRLARRRKQKRRRAEDLRRSLLTFSLLPPSWGMGSRPPTSIGKENATIRTKNKISAHTSRDNRAHHARTTMAPNAGGKEYQHKD